MARATGVAPSGDLDQPHQSSPCVFSTQVDGERRLSVLSAFTSWGRFPLSRDGNGFWRCPLSVQQMPSCHGRGNKDLSLRVLHFRTERFLLYFEGSGGEI